MPVDIEMVLSASPSPPLFRHNTLMNFGYPHYAPRNDRSYLDTKRNSFNSCRRHHISTPARSILIDKEQTEINHSKKKVWFADDKGMALTHVRVMTEPSDCPPRWTDDFIEKVTKGIRDRLSLDDSWEPLFLQPASDYLAFRTKLEKECVSLENVIVKEEDDVVTGTIKVKNISFDKEVSIRVTFDQWASQTDIPAIYVPSPLEQEGAAAPYDTFSFTFAIERKARKCQQIELCVRYKCGGSEYWDNNRGTNYKLVTGKNKTDDSVRHRKFVDALTANFTDWAEFASWNNLITEGPYW
uniref:Protein phosphatase 1 regulatory subunit 3C-B n=1 Tax=Hadrurus spadix TaxID=141984 RepID=A0A1W7R9Y2_9SCOR